MICNDTPIMLFTALLTQLGIGNVFMLQYRGYGMSTGTPNEKGINIDAQTGLDYIRNRHELRNSSIVLYGQSLGGAVSIGLGARNQKEGDIAGIILENTFLSMRKMIPSSVLPRQNPLTNVPKTCCTAQYHVAQ